MTILAFGLSHQTASVDLRGRVAFPLEDQERALLQMRECLADVREVVILSTCNRTEFHCIYTGSNVDPVRDWLVHDRQLTRGELDNRTYTYWHDDAVRHVFKVAAGLDSQILGEPQILGQLKAAYEFARGVGTVESELNLVATHATQTAKRIRTNTDIGKNPVTVAFAAVTMAQKIFANFGRTKTLLIGAGSNVRLVAKHLQNAGVRELFIANRTLANAQSLATAVGGTAIAIAEMSDYLHDFDIIISSTNSAQPLLSREILEAAGRKRRHRPVFIADLAIPRDIDPAAASLPDVYLYNVDDLSSIVGENLANRKTAAADAMKYINAGLSLHNKEVQTRRAAKLLAGFRKNTEQMRDSQLLRAKRRLEAGDDPTDVLERLAHDLTNQLAHAPTVTIRTASAEQDHRTLDLIRSIYEFDE